MNGKHHLFTPPFQPSHSEILIQRPHLHLINRICQLQRRVKLLNEGHRRAKIETTTAPAKTRPHAIN